MTITLTILHSISFSSKNEKFTHVQLKTRRIYKKIYWFYFSYLSLPFHYLKPLAIYIHKYYARWIWLIHVISVFGHFSIFFHFRSRPSLLNHLRKKKGKSVYKTSLWQSVTTQYFPPNSQVIRGRKIWNSNKNGVLSKIDGIQSRNSFLVQPN